MVTSLAALYHPLTNPKNVLDQSEGGQRCAPLMILGYRELGLPQIRGLSMELPLCAVNRPARRTAYYQSVSKVFPGRRRVPPPPPIPYQKGVEGTAVGLCRCPRGTTWRWWTCNPSRAPLAAGSLSDPALPAVLRGGGARRAHHAGSQLDVQLTSNSDLS
jgi:hypothetical protein